MLFTRRMDYGLRIMLALGMRGGERTSGEDLARDAEISRSFALKIVRRLAAEGLVIAKRGVGGGIELARPARQISLFNILRATDAARAINVCLLQPRVCPRSSTCAAHRLLQPIQHALDAQLQALSLADVVREQKAIARRGGRSRPAR
ncbi:MAG TPA: Rrf2 family transcriptional regulator [Phycisphaerae bacterium]|nr:Rrf2 family transcriptional regulator [Phycisphaerae bacterium]